MICKPTCVQGSVQNDWMNTCNLTSRTGGIPRILFLKCDPNLVLETEDGGGNTVDPYTLLDNWKYLLCNGYLYVTGNLLGQKPRGTTTKKRLQSCAPEQVIAGQKTLTFQDYNASIDELLDFDFWDFINRNQKFFKVGWITCDELVHLFGGNWDLDIDPISEDSFEGNMYWDGIITMSTKDIIVPIKVPGILALLDSFSNSTTCYT